MSLVITWLAGFSEVLTIQTKGAPQASAMPPSHSGKYGSGSIDWANPGVYQHIGYPSVVQLADGTILASYHEWSEDERPLQYVHRTRFRLAD